LIKRHDRTRYVFKSSKVDRTPYETLVVSDSAGWNATRLIFISNLTGNTSHRPTVDDELVLDFIVTIKY